jgi:hypothetical protein
MRNNKMVSVSFMQLYPSMNPICGAEGLFMERNITSLTLREHFHLTQGYTRVALEPKRLNLIN